jgi:hypothetical protein
MIEPITGARSNPGIAVMVTKIPALVAEPVSWIASQGKAMKTIDPDMTLKMDEICERTNGVLVVLSVRVFLAELKVIKTYR